VITHGTVELAVPGTKGEIAQPRSLLADAPSALRFPQLRTLSCD
jgi:hypothetical protein